MTETPNQVSIRRAVLGDLPGLLDFYRTHHANRPRLNSAELVRWIFLQPSLGHRIPYFVIDADGSVCGSIGCVHRDLHIGDRIVRAAFAINYFVAPKYKGLAALRLLRSVLGEADVVLGAYVSSDAKKVLGKMGFADRSGDVRGYYYGLDRGATKRQALIGFLLRSVEAVRRSVLGVVLPGTIYRVETTLESDFVRALCLQGGNRLLVSDEWLRWRYVDSPLLDCRFVYQLHGLEPIGIAVLHVDPQRDELVILDLFWKHESFLVQMALIAKVLALGRSLGCARVVTQVLSRRFHRVLSASLFRSGVSDLGFVFWAKDPALLRELSKSRHLTVMLGDTDAY